MGRLYFGQITHLHEEIDQIDRRAAEAKQSDIVRRLQKVPEIGPICAMAIMAFAPPMEAFRSGRDFAVWLSLVPRQSRADASISLAAPRRWANEI
ncbi:transposase [Rhizobium sp. BE258]|jgi:transposase|nr:transposase [Rhizobium sp. BE258]MDR7147734.1 transposase [Rhizobium sp. BE258]